MLSYLNDPKAELLKSYLPPFKGTWKTLPSHLLPDDVVQDSLNVTLLSGSLRSRLGLLLYNTFQFPNKPLGSFMFIDSNNSKIPIVSTMNKVYKYISGSWIDFTGSTVLNGLDTSQIRMTSIQDGTSIYLLYTNNVDRLLYSNNAGTLSAITANPGDPVIPICKDICTSFSRLIAITPPYTIQWSSVLNDSYLSLTSWPALNQAILSDTEDALVAIRPIGTLGIAVYKEGNIFIGIAQAGPQSTAFRFEHRGEYEGPAGVNAIVKATGTNIYMTSTGRVGIFDGSTHQWICDGIWPYLQDDLDTAYSYKIFGVYNYRTSEVYFWYPRMNDFGVCKGMVIINLAYPLAGVQAISYFLGSTEFECSNGLSVTLFNAITSPLVFSSGLTKQTFILDKDTYTDNSVSFNCNFSTGTFKPTAPNAVTHPNLKDKSDVYRPIVEFYSTRDDTRGTVDISVLTSNQLESTGTQSEIEVIDLSVLQTNEYIGFNRTGSFLGVKAEWDSLSKVEYKGTDVYGRRGN